MESVIQRVQESVVTVNHDIVGKIDQGLLVLLCVEQGDLQKYADKLLHKIIHLRIFEDDQSKMNLSLKDIGGALLVVSQFTLAADLSRGLRPSFSRSASIDLAKSLYLYFIKEAKKHLLKVETGVFGAHMKIALVNDGPVTFRLSVKEE